MKLCHLHPNGPRKWLGLLNWQVPAAEEESIQLHVRGFSAAALALTAATFATEIECQVKLGGVAMPPAQLLGLCRLALLKTASGAPKHSVSLIHFASDSSRRRKPKSLFWWIGQHAQILYVEDRPHNWGGKDTHNYSHLLENGIPPGCSEIMQLATQFAQARPLKFQI